MLTAVLATAFLVRSYMLLAVVVPERLKLRDDNDIVLHLLCAACCIAGQHWFHIDLRNALAAAIIADVVVHLRELLDMVKDLCKTRLLNGVRRTRR